MNVVAVAWRSFHSVCACRVVQVSFNAMIPLSSDDTVRDFLGHEFSVVTRRYFPTIDYYDVHGDGDVADDGGSGKARRSKVVVPRDSLNSRMLETIASALNFT